MCNNFLLSECTITSTKASSRNQGHCIYGFDSSITIRSCNISSLSMRESILMESSSTCNIYDSQLVQNVSGTLILDSDSSSTILATGCDITGVISGNVVTCSYPSNTRPNLIVSNTADGNLIWNQSIPHTIYAISN
jgi:hypothetical protein